MKGKDKSKHIITITFIIIIIGSLITYYKLTDKINELDNKIINLQSTIDTLHYSVVNIESTTIKELEKQSSILSDFKISYGRPNGTTLLGDVTITVVPKEYSEDAKAAITLGNKSYEMIRKGNKFVSVITIPVNVVYPEFTVAIKDDGDIKAQVVSEEEISFRDFILNKADASFSGDTYKEHGKLTFDGTIEAYLSISSADEAIFAPRVVAIKNNNESLWESKEISKGSGGRYPVNNETGRYYLPIKESFSVGEKDSLAIYIEFKDSNGFSYRVMVQGTEYYGDNAEIDTYEPQVLDSQGKAIEFRYFE